MAEIEVLKGIGFEEREAKIYISLLKLNLATASEIAGQTGIERTTIYDILSRLIEKGIVSHFTKNNVKYFKAVEPEKLLSDLQERQRDLESIIPKLHSLMNFEEEPFDIQLLKGVSGLKYFLKDAIKAKKEILIFGLDERKFEAALPVYMGQYFRDEVLNNIKERVITFKKKNVYTFPKETAPNVTYRFLDVNELDPATTIIYGKKVAIIFWLDPITAILINNSGVAKTYKSHFEHLWKIASKTP